MLLPACRNPYLLKNCNLGRPTTYTSRDGARQALSQALPELFALPLRQLVPLFMLISPLATAPVLTIHDYIPQKESIILQYSLTSAGTIWCRAYREEEKDYATVEGVYAGIQGIAVVAHVISNYYIGNLEPNTDYYTFCVAEDEHQVAMSTLFESTERHVITLAGTPPAVIFSSSEPPFLSYLGNTVTYHSISISALSNVRADVYNYTAVLTPDYAYPSVSQVKLSVPDRVPRLEPFVLTFDALQNATEYAVSLYAEDLKQVASEQPIASTTFFITTDSIRCFADGDWSATAAGSFAELPCERGFSGAIRRWCDWEGVWGEPSNECGAFLHRE